MTFKVAFEPVRQVAVLSHHGPVDASEIKASRIALRERAVQEKAAGVVIDIRESEIDASPGEIIPNVATLCEELPAPVRLAFVARRDHQSMVSMIVATVAFNTGAAVGQFDALDTAACWLTSTPEEATACGCLPDHER